MSEHKKQSFLHGTMLLAASAIIVKVIGFFYSVPMNDILGEVGFGYYSTAYDIYTLLLMISTTGLPVAMSRMVSAAASLGHYRRMRKIYVVSRTVYLTLGFLGAVLMTGFSTQLANFQEQPDSWAAIAALGPSCFLICLMSTYRGYFQGQSNMIPTSVSQVLEAVVKLVVGIAGAVLLLYYTQSYALAAGGAIAGVTISCLASSIYLNRCFRKDYRDLPQSDEEEESTKVVVKTLLAIAIPITIGSAGLQLLNVLETRIYMSELKHIFTNSFTADQLRQILADYHFDGDLAAMTHEQLSQTLADSQKGIFNFCMKIYNLPVAIITSVNVSLIPAITAQITRGEQKAAKITSESSARITALLAAPCAIGLAVLSGPVTALLGGYTGARLDLSTDLMLVFAMCVLFNSVVQFTTTLLQAYNHVNLPVINMFIGGIVKLAVVAILTANPAIGMLGATLGSLSCYLCITALNLITIKKVIPDAPAIAKNLLRSVFAAVLMGGFVWLTYYGLTLVLGPATGRNMNAIILCAVPILVGVVTYVIAALKFKAITREDCLLLPKGDKIAKLLHL